VGELQTRFDLGEDVTEELHGMLSRWLFNHIRHEDHGYVDAAKAYLRMVQQNSPQAERERMRAQIEAKLRKEKRGWLARLFGGWFL